MKASAQSVSSSECGTEGVFPFPFFRLDIFILSHRFSCRYNSDYTETSPPVRETCMPRERFVNSCCDKEASEPSRSAFLPRIRSRSREICSRSRRRAMVLVKRHYEEDECAESKTLSFAVNTLRGTGRLPFSEHSTAQLGKP